ncbi:MAG: Flp pilus assembly protein CpaB [Planctomycetes bacterium]|nr:Flp pilus assembly protein CpaB [Planctomycetota bacterium]
MKNMMAIVIAVGLGLFSVFAVNTYITSSVEEQVGKKVQVIVVRTRIPAGSLIQPDFISEQVRPAAGLDSSTVQLSDKTKLLSQRARIDLEQGTIIRWADIAQTEGEGGRWSSRIKAGKRAVTLPVDELSGVAGRLQPGDKVDILITYAPVDPNSGTPGGKSKITYMLSEMPILDLGGYITKGMSGVGGALGDILGPKSYSTITFEVTPSDAELLVFAMAQGKMHFVLRNPQEPAGITGVGAIDTESFDTFVKSGMRGK